MINQSNNPLLKPLVEMAQTGNSKGVEEAARKMFQENGRDFDKEFSSFMNQFNN